MDDRASQGNPGGHIPVAPDKPSIQGVPKQSENKANSADRMVSAGSVGR